MNISTLRIQTMAAALAVTVAGCAVPRPELQSDLNAGLEVAAALESAYAARSSADPRVVAQASRLLASAEAAVNAFSTSSTPADQAAANAAIAALVAYEASAHVSP